MLEAVVALTILATTLSAFFVTVHLHLRQPGEAEKRLRKASALVTGLNHIGADIALRVGRTSREDDEIMVSIAIDQIDQNMGRKLFRIHLEAHMKHEPMTDPLTVTTYRIGR